MNGAVRIARLVIENVGIHVQRVDLGELSPRLNVISGGNEAGKSTLIAALRAALFERHDAKHQGIKALQPYATRAAPEVWVDLDLDGERIHVHKRFLEKPLAELRDTEGGSVRMLGSDVDHFLLQRLGGHTPGKQGAKAGDMGLWGLLWVSQDETAYSDPVALLDEKKDPQAEEVRGALAEIISRQVGQIIGGRQGERVRSRVVEHLAAFYTDKQGTPTGEYRKAIKGKEDADLQVEKIEQAVRQVEDHALELQRKKERLIELDRQKKRLEKEHDDAQLSTKRAEALQGYAQQLRASHEAAQMRLQVAQKALDERHQAQKEQQDLGERITGLRPELQERERLLASQREVLHEAQEHSRAARKEASQRSQELVVLSRQLDRQRRVRELGTLSQQLTFAEQVAGELAELLQQTAQTLDTVAYERVQGLHDEVRSLRTVVETAGTRLVTEEAGQEPRLIPVAVSWSGEIPRLGQLRLDAARPGLSKVSEQLRQARTRLEQALQENSVIDLQQAREQRTAAQADEEELDQLRTRLGELAPDGLDAITRALREHSTKRQRIEQQLREARQAAAELRELDPLLDANPFDDATIQQLREANQQALTTQAACAQIGTLVELHALKDVSVQLGDAPAVLLKAGERRPAQPLTAQTTVVVGDLLKLSLEPRGQDLTRVRAQQERAEAELHRQLEKLEVSDLSAAESHASLRAQRMFARDAAQRRLREAAPGADGLLALADEAERFSREDVRLLRADKEARQLDNRLRFLEDRNRDNRISKPVLSRLENLSREVSELEGEQRTFAARLVCDGGPLSKLVPLGETRLISEPLRLELEHGMICTVLPGDAAAGAELAHAEGQLAAELAEMGLADISTAGARHRQGVQLHSQVEALDRRLSELAPAGVEALRDLVQSKRAAIEEAAVHQQQIPTAGDPDELLRGAEEALRTAESAAHDAERIGETRRKDCEELDRELQRKRSTLEIDQSQLTKLTQKLDDAQLHESNQVLADRQRKLADEHTAALLAWKRAAEDSAAMTIADLHEEQTRAAQTVSDWGKQRNTLHGEVIRLQTLLERAAAEGHFELLTEARVAQSAATAEFTRMDREAKAARRLADVVHAVYEEEQQRFLAPVLKESQPYLRALRPGTELRLSSNFRLEKVTRHGTEEDFGQLSGGTREQLSVIVRLALARVLAKDSRPLPLILDDPMGWTDDDRFIAMVKILRDAARDLQVIVLTCHPERFRRLQADCTIDLGVLKLQGGTLAQPAA